MGEHKMLTLTDVGARDYNILFIHVPSKKNRKIIFHSFISYAMRPFEPDEKRGFPNEI